MSNHFAAHDGFTLIELAVCIVLVGLVASASLTFFAGKGDQDCMAATQEKLAIIEQKLNEYSGANNRYPRPANPSLGSADAFVGREVPSGSDAAIARVGSAPGVLIGALPHATLGLPDEFLTDCWGRNYLYAITEELTQLSSAANLSTRGRITVRRGGLSSAQTLSSEASYVVVSQGDVALTGATGTRGPANPFCNGSSSPRTDRENCDTANAVFYTSNSRYVSELFDDLVLVGERPSMPSNSCGSGNVTWGNCSAPALLTLNGLSVNLTNITSGYTGVALSTCTNGVRSTLGVCLPIGACQGTNPRTGLPMTLLTGIGMNFGTPICKSYRCCNGAITSQPLPFCTLPVDLPGIAITCP